MSTVLITGANRGLGLEFARQYAHAGWHVIATCRDPGAAEALGGLPGAIEIHPLDLADLAAIDALAERLGRRHVDLLLNNAGVYGGEAARLGEIDYAAWERVLRINAVAPLRMAEAFRPHLEAGRGRLVAAVSSGLGSIGDVTSGGGYAYRTGKAALNMAFRTLSVDLRAVGIAVVLLNPGWVRTDMGGPNATLAPKDSVARMRKVLDGVGIDDTGRFINHDGKDLPW
jgi:NAD(P)-dependent dehydrogenase (short-subunit alcohol dehydrogenase family)